MKCTNNNRTSVNRVSVNTGPGEHTGRGASARSRAAARKRRLMKKRRRQQRIAAVLISLVVLIGAGSAAFFLFSGLSGDTVAAYGAEKYSRSLYEGTLFADDLCVSTEDVALDGFADDASFYAAGLFNLNSRSVVCGYHLYNRIYPASTTKVLTGYLALKYGNLEDVVTVSEHATDFEWDASVCGLRTGDQITLYDLVCGLLLHSGNDCATAIAEHISGSEEAFVVLMNKEAWALGATGTHFVNPHGLPDEEHYTTAYDLYLMFNAAMKDERFAEIISMTSYKGTLTGADGTVRTETWEASNYYSSGQVQAPDGIRVLGGKTGTTDLARTCVILYCVDSQENPYISVIMGASSRNALYEAMNRLYTAGISA